LDGQWTAFGKIGRSFRISTINENYDSFSGTVTMLEPQKSLDREIGVEFAGGNYRLRATVYRIDLRNELAFNAITFSNMNLAPARREGIELGGRMQLGTRASLFANYTYAVAKFREGVYGGVDVSGNDVPLVPRHIASVGGTVAIAPETRFSTSIRYVGEQRFDNDQTNDFVQRMPSYTTVDVKLSHRIDQWTLSATVNNLLNEKYYSYAVRSTFLPGTFNAYPMPERNVWLSVGYEFK
jgi:iron complex outermembrane receptor protein